MTTRDDTTAADGGRVSAVVEARRIARRARETAAAPASGRCRRGSERSPGCPCGCASGLYLDDPACARHSSLRQGEVYRIRMAAQRAAEGRASAEDLDLLRRAAPGRAA